jgi:hypothetical protein
MLCCKKLLWVLSFLSIIPKLYAQKVDKVYLSANDTTNNYFLAVTPNDSIQTKAFMFLVPGAFELPEDVLVQTDLPYVAAGQGISVFIPVFSTGISGFAVDDSTQESFRQMVDYCVRRYQLENKKFYVGGFSLGGTCAVKFAELSVADNATIKPAAVFAIDPPLDYERFYYAAKRNLRLMGKYASFDFVFMLKGMMTKFNGTPETALANYYKYSPYSYNDTTQSAVKLLQQTPISIYAEPDIEWWLNNFAFDYYDMNCIDGAAMINELHLMGNRNARFIATHDKGKRMPKNIKHPHSWSIVDTQELLNWFDSIKN